MAGSSESHGQSTSEGQGTSESHSQTYIPDYPQAPLLMAIAQYAFDQAPQVYQWGMDQFNKNQGNIDGLMRDALSYASPQRIAVDMGMAEAGVQQGAEKGRLSAIRDLESYGIDPSSGRYAALDQANRVMASASAAGAGNQQRMADEAAGNAMRNQAISASLQNTQVGYEAAKAMNALLGTGMQLKYPPLGNRSDSFSQHTQVSQSTQESKSEQRDPIPSPSKGGGDKGGDKGGDQGKNQPQGGGGGGGARPAGGGGGAGAGGGGGGAKAARPAKPGKPPKTPEQGPGEPQPPGEEETRPPEAGPGEEGPTPGDYPPDYQPWDQPGVLVPDDYQPDRLPPEYEGDTPNYTGAPYGSDYDQNPLPPPTEFPRLTDPPLDYTPPAGDTWAGGEGTTTQQEQDVSGTGEGQGIEYQLPTDAAGQIYTGDYAGQYDPSQYDYDPSVQVAGDTWDVSGGAQDFSPWQQAESGMDQEFDPFAYDSNQYDDVSGTGEDYYGGYDFSGEDFTQYDPTDEGYGGFDYGDANQYGDDYGDWGDYGGYDDYSQYDSNYDYGGDDYGGYDDYDTSGWDDYSDYDSNYDYGGDDYGGYDDYSDWDTGYDESDWDDYSDWDTGYDESSWDDYSDDSWMDDQSSWDDYSDYDSNYDYGGDDYGDYGDYGDSSSGGDDYSDYDSNYDYGGGDYGGGDYEGARGGAVTKRGIIKPGQERRQNMPMTARGGGGRMRPPGQGPRRPRPPQRPPRRPTGPPMTGYNPNPQLPFGPRSGGALDRPPQRPTPPGGPPRMARGGRVPPRRPTGPLPPPNINQQAAGGPQQMPRRGYLQANGMPQSQAGAMPMPMQPPQRMAQGGPARQQGPDPRQATQGGFVSRELSPSGGSQVDDVDAKLNSGEFVIPKDVAKWKGKEFFYKLIQQARKNGQGGGGQQQQQPTGYGGPRQ